MTSADDRDAYADLAGEYDADGRHREQAERLIERVSHDPDWAPAVVDCAGGTGIAARAVLAHWPRALVEVVDDSSAMLAAGADEYPDPAVTWVQATAFPLRYPRGTVDVVVCTASLHFLGWSALDDWARVLRPGGLVAFTMPYRSRFHPSGTFAELLAIDPGELPDSLDEATAIAAGHRYVQIDTFDVGGAIGVVATPPTIPIR